MASSTKDHCRVCVYALQAPRNTAKEEQEDDNFTIIVNLAIVETVEHDPKVPSGVKQPFRYAWSRTKTFKKSRSTFCSASESQQLQFALTTIQGLNLDIPFRLENIHWQRGFKFPTNVEPSRKLDSMDQAVSRFLDAARTCAGEKGNGVLEIRITQLHKLSLEEYNRSVEKGPLDDWLEENKDEPGAARARWRAPYLHQKSRETNPCFGLKSVMVKEPHCCSICTDDMEEGKQAIRMPCSHIFHGVCLFDWIRVDATCPLCRFVLFTTASKPEEAATEYSKQETFL